MKGNPHTAKHKKKGHTKTALLDRRKPKPPGIPGRSNYPGKGGRNA